MRERAVAIALLSFDSQLAGQVLQDW